MNINNMSIKQLRQIAQPASMTSNDLFSHEFWMRNISIYFSLIFIRIGLSGYHILILHGIFMSIGICLFALEAKIYWIIGGFFLFISGLLDFCDGEVARLKNQCSIQGIWHDRLWHEITLPIVWLCIGYGQYKVTGSDLYLFMGFIMTAFGPWADEVDERAKQVTLAIIAIRDGLGINKSNIAPLENIEIKEDDRTKGYVSKNPNKYKKIIAFPVKLYALLGDLGLTLILLAIIDNVWKGVFILNTRVTAIGIYMALTVLLTVPFSLQRIIRSARQQEPEKYVNLAIKKVYLKE